MKKNREDYNLAFRQAVYNKAMDGLKLTNEEIKQADKALIEAGLYQSYYNLQGSLDGLKANHQKSGGEMPITAGKQNIEYARRAGQAVLQYREYKAKGTDAAIESGKNYVNGAIGGFVEKPYNAVVNNINGLSEPFRAGEKRFSAQITFQNFRARPSETKARIGSKTVTASRSIKWAKARRRCKSG